ncbi:MAG: NAD-glutamate dehydrogenase, partial [Deltaproteobacteria bacterium]
DPLNRLLLRADIPWPSVVLVLAYNSYARQTGLPYSPATVQEALLRNAGVVRSLTELFHAKFDPAIEGQSETDVDERRLQLVERARRAVLLQLEAIDDLTSDQVLRTLYNLIESTVRTNFYARDPNREHHVVLKFDPQSIVRMPEPRPFREIFVFHPLISGLHLRGGPVARGGIRWSDRLIDFRTEVLGLMATQNLKNVLIVPRGAKGAFVLRNPPSDMGQRRQHADEMYKIFISGLLDVTDNLVNGKHITPKGVLRYDDLDHYLVVAADKGTAHLSDTANALAEARGFWLSDGFASGGSKGYDHKKEAITSRGAWACVRRHFREINMDPEKDTIRVVGIGDMSGDVFGNGMLRSQSMQLVAAFDHRHIFIDPNPDAARSFAARLKLFQTPRSSWEDYPKDVMSPGSGIYPRGAKSIRLSSEARQALAITATELSAPELVQAILRAPVDLLWNGGIFVWSAQTILG